MGKSYWKSNLRRVRDSLGRFMAIFAIVALGVGFLAGLLSATPDMRYSFDRYFAETGLYDLRLLSNMGISEEDVEALSALESVEALRPAYLAELLMSTGPETELAVRIHSLGPEQSMLPEDSEGEQDEQDKQGKWVNCPLLTAGRWPEGAGECLVVNSPLKPDGVLPLGTWLRPSENERDPGRLLAPEGLKVVGFADFAPYFSSEKEFTAVGGGTVDLILLAPEAAFAQETYTEVYLRVRGADEYRALTEGYAAHVDAASQEVKEAFREQSRERFAQVQEAIRRELEAGQQEIQLARQELERGEERLVSSQNELDNGENELKAAQKSVEGGELELKTAELRLQWQLMDKGGTEPSALADFLAARQQLSQARERLAEEKRRLEARGEELAGARAVFAQERERYINERELAEAELRKAEADLIQEAIRLERQARPLFKLQSRASNLSYHSLSTSIDKVGAIARVFPFFFFLVAALVALTTMTRMVEDQRLEIGSLRALGYGSGAILGRYLLYALAASVLGCLVGGAIGFFLFPRAIWILYSMMYRLPRFYYPIHWPLALATCGAVVACILLATAKACRESLCTPPARLLQAKAPQPGKRIFLERIGPLWRRLPFLYKVTARNLFRYKKRFLMTSLGVAGCTALLLAGLGLRDSVLELPQWQFEQLHTYDLTALLIKGREADSGLETLLETGGEIEAALRLHTESLRIERNGRRLDLQGFVSRRAEDLNGFVNLRQRQGGAALELSQDGLILSEKAAELLELTVGDLVKLQTLNGAEADFTLTGICENYLGGYAFLTEAGYYAGFGTIPAQNRILLRLDAGAEAKEVGRLLLKTGAVSGLFYTGDVKATFVQTIDKLDAIVLLILASAGTLALVVLYNLTNINISERVSEIASLKVLGFTQAELRAYINREGQVLTLIGIVLGLGLGVFLHRYIVASAEVNLLMFRRELRGVSLLLAAALTFLFSLIVAVLMQKKLKDISMVESLRAPE